MANKNDIANNDDGIKSNSDKISINAHNIAINAKDIDTIADGIMDIGTNVGKDVADLKLQLQNKMVMEKRFVKDTDIPRQNVRKFPVVTGILMLLVLIVGLQLDRIHVSAQKVLSSLESLVF